MQKTLTITLDEEVYDGLYRVVGAGRISRFIEQVVRPHVVAEAFDAAYEAVAADEEREAAAEEWADGLLGDASDEASSTAYR